MVTSLVVLDSGPLGLVSNPRRSRNSLDCGEWLESLLAAKVRVVLPEITDYEVRRELLRAKKEPGIERLNTLATLLEYVPITTPVIRRAAELWARARQQGQPTGDAKALDGDVILAAQALSLGTTELVVATTNVKHLSRFVPAARWTDIEPPAKE